MAIKSTSIFKSLDKDTNHCKKGKSIHPLGHRKAPDSQGETTPVNKDPSLLSYRKRRSLKDVLIEQSFEGHILDISTNRSHFYFTIIDGKSLTSQQQAHDNSPPKTRGLVKTKIFQSPTHTGMRFLSNPFHFPTNSLIVPGW